MLRRQTRPDAALDRRVVRMFASGSEHFTHTWLGDEVFDSPEAARAAWPLYRRAVWGATWRFHAPAAAEYFDSLTSEAWRVLWDSAYHAHFPLERALDALERDRAALAAFQAREPGAARELHDYFALWLEDLDSIERLSRQCAGIREPFQRPKVTAVISTSRTYGDGDSSAA
jgi:hypothetical protein